MGEGKPEPKRKFESNPELEMLEGAGVVFEGEFNPKGTREVWERSCRPKALQTQKEELQKLDC